MFTQKKLPRRLLRNSVIVRGDFWMVRLGILFCIAVRLGILFCIASTTAFPLIPSAFEDDRSKNLLLPFGIIGDVDALSKQGNIWYSPMTIGTLSLDENRTSASVQWIYSFNYTSTRSYNNRGMELSDLKYFNRKLITVDDKTGIVYWIDGKDLIPWTVLTGINDTDPTPFKGEWLTVKDGFLYCGGQGREEATATGEFISDYSLYVKRISKNGVVESGSWAKQFIALRAAIQIRFPGYLIHEAVQWSDVHKKWFFLPRHVSKLAYNVSTVSGNGANVLLSSNEDFTNFSAVMIGHEVHDRGFSAFQFVPGTKDTVIAAVKSQELLRRPFASFIMVFTIDGRVILDETRILGDIKYEGIEFLSDEHFKSFVG